jgi:hypothetical protein
MFGYNRLQILYNPGTCGRFVAALCKQMRDGTQLNLISKHGSCHFNLLTRNPPGTPVLIDELHITREQCWQDIANQPNTKNIFVKMSNYQEDLSLAVKLHFIKRYYEEDQLSYLTRDWFANVNLKFVSLSRETATRLVVEKLFYYVDNSMAYPSHNILFARENLPPESDAVIHLDFRSILNGNPEIIPLLEKFTGFTASPTTYKFLRDYRNAQISIGRFLDSLP